MPYHFVKHPHQELVLTVNLVTNIVQYTHCLRQSIDMGRDSCKVSLISFLRVRTSVEVI